jgi:Holliday junction resolvase RusA-like endonuclease
MILELTVPGEPVAWQRPRLNRKTGAIFTPKPTINYENAIAWEARGKGVKFGDREVIVYTDFFCGNKRMKDADNIHKACLDALQKAEVFHDDNQVAEGHYRIFRGVENPRTEIRVYPVDHLQFG